MSSHFVRWGSCGLHHAFDQDPTLDPQEMVPTKCPGHVPVRIPMEDLWQPPLTQSGQSMDDDLLTTPFFDSRPFRETHQDNSANDHWTSLLLSVETDEQKESKGLSPAQRLCSPTLDLTPVSREEKKGILVGSRHKSVKPIVVNTAPNGSLFYCPSFKCNRSYNGKGYHRRGDCANHMRSHHPELPQHDFFASLKTIPRHGPELQKRRQYPWTLPLDLEQPSSEVDCGPSLAGSGGSAECSSSSSIPSLTYSASTSSLAQSSRRARAPNSRERAFGPHVSSCRLIKKRGTSCSSQTDNEEPEQEAIGATNPRYVAQASNSGYEPPNGETLLVDKDVHDFDFLALATSSPLPSSHQHFPRRTQFTDTKSTAPWRWQDDLRSAHMALKPPTGELVNDLSKIFVLTERASPQTQYSAPPAKEYEDRAEASAIGSEDVNEDDGLEELSVEEEVAACFGSKSARFAANAFEKIASDNFASLLRVGSGFRQCPSGTNSSPDSSTDDFAILLRVGDVFRQCPSGTNSSPGSSTEAHLPTPAKTSSSPGSDKRKTPPGGADGDQGKDQSGKDGGDGGRPFKKRKGDPEAQAQAKLRWDCPFDRTPSGVASSPPGCAETGLQLNDLWIHLKRIHLGCSDCGQKFSGELDASRHYHDRFRASICIPDANRVIGPHIGYDDFLQMEKAYEERDRRDLQKTWAQWWRLIHKTPSPEHIPPSGVHQGTISFPSAVLPQLRTWVNGEWQGLAAEGKVPYLTRKQYQELGSLIEKAIRLFGCTHEVRQRRTKKPAQSVQMIPTPDSASANTAIPPSGTSGTTPSAEVCAHRDGEDDLAGPFAGYPFEPQSLMFFVDDFTDFYQGIPGASPQT